VMSSGRAVMIWDIERDFKPLLELRETNENGDLLRIADNRFALTTDGSIEIWEF
jgi:hypothetical protein